MISIVIVLDKIGTIILKLLNQQGSQGVKEIIDTQFSNPNCYNWYFCKLNQFIRILGIILKKLKNSIVLNIPQISIS